MVTGTKRTAAASCFETPFSRTRHHRKRCSGKLSRLANAASDNPLFVAAARASLA